jgi:hypothetical protein
LRLLPTLENTLPPRTQLILKLRDEGHTYKHIGQQLGITRQRVIELWRQAHTAKPRPTKCWCGNPIPPPGNKGGKPKTYCTPEHAPYNNTIKNFTRADYKQLHQKQNGLCAICGNLETAADGYGGTRTLAADHNHTTGNIRELLCGHCNKMLGHFNDNPETLEAAAAYLQKHQLERCA